MEAARVYSPVATCYRVCSVSSKHFRSPIGVNTNGSIRPRGKGLDCSLDLAWHHLLWHHVPTPWISLFTNYHAALRRAAWLEGQGVPDVLIVFVNTHPSQRLELYDAHALSRTLGFDIERRQCHKYEYLHRGSIAPNVLFAKMRAMGPTQDIPGRLCTLRVSSAFAREIQRIRLPDETEHEAIKRFLTQYLVDRGIDDDGVMCVQLMKALCVWTGDDISNIAFGPLSG